MRLAEAARLVKEDCEKAFSARVASLLAPLRGGTIFITGGTGFVGTWLAEGLTHLNDSHRFRTRIILLGTRADRFAEQAPHLASRNDIEILERDVRYLTDIPQQVSWIIHAAGTPDNRVHASDPLLSLRVFVHGVDAVLLAATRLPTLQRFLNVSSGLVYGPQPWSIEHIPEDFRGAPDWLSVGSAYTEGKRTGETICAAYRTQHRLQTLTVRPFAFVGPYQHLDRPWAINNFLHDALHGGPIRILGNGDTVRSYMYPSDMAAWFLGLLVAGDVGGEYNVGSSQAVSLSELAERIRAQFPNRIEIQTAGASRRASIASRFVPDVSRAQAALGFDSSVELETAIHRTLRWHKALSVQPSPYAVV